METIGFPELLVILAIAALDRSPRRAEAGREAGFRGEVEHGRLTPVSARALAEAMNIRSETRRDSQRLAAQDVNVFRVLRMARGPDLDVMSA